MKTLKRINILFCLLILTLCSCESTKLSSKKIQITKCDDAFLWQIDGFDKKGQPSKVYCLGTIHIADDKIYPWPKCVDEAFNSSDRYAGEISYDDLNTITNKVTEMIFISMANANKAEARLPAGLSDKEIEFIQKNIPGYQNYYFYEPWVLNLVIQGLQEPLYNLSSEKGYDQYIMNVLKEKGIKHDGLDSLQTQLDIVKYGDWNFQLFVLKQTIKEFVDSDYFSTLDLYNAYAENNEQKIKEILNTEYQEDEESSKYEKEVTKFENELLLKRNKSWAKQIKNYLAEGGTTFVFAGCAHFLYDNNVFEFLK